LEASSLPPTTNEDFDMANDEDTSTVEPLFVNAQGQTLQQKRVSLWYPVSMIGQIGRTHSTIGQIAFQQQRYSRPTQIQMKILTRMMTPIMAQSLTTTVCR
jgi:hypothetical protein